jgi:hypothetical protein
VIRRTQTLLEHTTGGTRECVTRARIRANTSTGWQQVDLHSHRHPGEVGNRLHIVQIIKADDTEQ